ncbi:MAG: OmpA family protein [Chitinophagaceae bacterium]|nr:MAG: OmpA family protein [Chitinophagaceae bacterium]
MKKLLLILFFCSTLISVKGQDYLGIVNMNYGGVTSMDFQPASIVDMRYKVDINIIGISTTFHNNYISVNRDFFRSDSMFSADNWQERYFSERMNDDNKFIYFNNQIQLPSFAVSLGPRASIGLSWRMRTKFNFDNIDPDLAKLAWEGVMYPPLHYQDLSNENLSVQLMNWAEYGVTFGMVLMDRDQHFLKGAARAKLLQGIFAAYLYADELRYSWSGSDTVTIVATNASYGHSDNFEVDEETLNYRFTANPTLGYDFGLVYEYRPNRRRYQYEYPEGVMNDRRDKEKYAFKVGLSVLDIGRLRFNKHPNSRNFYADIEDWYVKDFDLGSVADFDDTINSRFIFTEDEEEDFLMNMPTAISIQADLRLWRNFYLNVTPFWAVYRNDQEERVRELTRWSIAPRFDSKWFGAALPFSFAEGGQRALGASVRLGPLVVGTNNFLPFFNSDGNFYGADFHFALKVPIPHNKPKIPVPEEWETIRREVTDTLIVMDTVRVEERNVITIYDTVTVEIVQLKQKESEILQTAFDNLEFESGQDIIKARSFRSLEDLALLLTENEDWNIKLEGHTDNIGGAEFNMNLSRSRAKSIKRFLTDRGISGERIIVEYYGEEKPIADNDTPEGRQRNRRVEMQIIKDIEE